MDRKLFLMKHCKTCLTEIPEKRWDLGYRVCTTCSTEARWSGVPVINHKTGNEVQIVKDPEVAAEFLAKSARVGFGTLRGMTRSYRRPTNNNEPPKEVVIEPVKPVSAVVIARRALPNDYESVGHEVMCILEAGTPELALAHIDQALESRRIYRNHATQLRDIVNALCSTNLNSI